MSLLQKLQKQCALFGPSGYENEVREYLQKEIKFLFSIWKQEIDVLIKGFQKK